MALSKEELRNCDQPAIGIVEKRLSSSPLLNQNYTINPSTNAYIIEIALNDYVDIFDPWDPAPFQRRSIHADLARYLEGCSAEIPLSYPVELSFIIPPAQQNQQLEEESKTGLQNSFAFKMYLLKTELSKTNLQILRWIVFGFVLLWARMMFSEKLELYASLSLFDEAFMIGGWVFLWEAVSLFFFTNREVYERYRIYQRLHQAMVVFQETASSKFSQK